MALNTIDLLGRIRSINVGSGRTSDFIILKVIIEASLGKNKVNVEAVAFRKEGEKREFENLRENSLVIATCILKASKFQQNGGKQSTYWSLANVVSLEELSKESEDSNEDII